MCVNAINIIHNRDKINLTLKLSGLRGITFLALLSSLQRGQGGALQGGNGVDAEEDAGRWQQAEDIARQSLQFVGE